MADSGARLRLRHDNDTSMADTHGHYWNATSAGSYWVLKHDCLGLPLSGLLLRWSEIGQLNCLCWTWLLLEYDVSGTCLNSSGLRHLVRPYVDRRLVDLTHNGFGLDVLDWRGARFQRRPYDILRPQLHSAGQDGKLDLGTVRLDGLDNLGLLHLCHVVRQDLNGTARCLRGSRDEASVSLLQECQLLGRQSKLNATTSVASGW